MSEPVFTTLLTEPIKYEEGVQAGFIVFPHSDEVPKGWGEPYFDANKNPIWPGTPNTDQNPAPNVNRAVGIVKNNVWKMRRSADWQVAGAIDWWGPWKTTKHTKRKVLSWHGPPERYFNPNNAFVYSNLNPKHKEIYTDGKLLDIAPYPVLGAALTTWNKPKTEGTGTEPETLLVVIVKNGAIDEAYSKVAGGVTIYAKVTDEMRMAKSRIQSDEFPNGWTFCGAFKGPSGMVDPEVPWFFNGDGTKARTMRRQVKTFTNERQQEKTQNAYVELFFTFNPSTKGCSFDYTDEDKKFTYKEVCKKTHPTWTDVEADQWGLYHDWQEDTVDLKVTCKGTVKVAVDWSTVDNAWRYAWFDVDDYRWETQFWTVGIDDPGAPHTNNGSHTGKRYPASAVPKPGDHTENPWMYVREFRWLKMGKEMANPALALAIGIAVVGTKQFAQTGVYDPNVDPIFYFWESLDVFLHHFDLRTFLITGRMRYDAIYVPQDGAGVGTQRYYSEIMEWGAVVPNWPWDESSFFSRYTTPVGADANSVFYWTREQMQSWPEAYDIT